MFAVQYTNTNLLPGYATKRKFLKPNFQVPKKNLSLIRKKTKNGVRKVTSFSADTDWRYALSNVFVVFKIIWKWKDSARRISSKITWSDSDQCWRPVDRFEGNSRTYWPITGCFRNSMNGYLRQHNFIYCWIFVERYRY